MQKFLTLFLLVFVVVSCKSEKKKAAQSFEAALEAATGNSFTIAKLQTEKGNYTVYRNENTGEYVAYNMDKWNRETMSSLDQFNAVAVAGDVVGGLNKDREWVDSGYWESVYDTRTYTDDYYDSVCGCYQTETRTESYYVGERYVDTSHWYTFYTGGGFRFENNSGVSKDLETLAALKEAAAESFMASKFKSEFSLSDDRASEMAKLASKYQRLENARELTTSEKDKFALSALGVSMNQIEVAMKKKAQGSDAQYADLLKTAAQVNNTTPEQIGKFFDEVVEGI